MHMNISLLYFSDRYISLYWYILICCWTHLAHFILLCLFANDAYMRRVMYRTELFTHSKHVISFEASIFFRQMNGCLWRERNCSRTNMMYEIEFQMLYDVRIFKCTFMHIWSNSIWIVISIFRICIQTCILHRYSKNDRNFCLVG